MKTKEQQIEERLAEARDTSFISIENSYQWARVENRLRKLSFIRKLTPIEVGRLIVDIIDHAQTNDVGRA